MQSRLQAYCTRAFQTRFGISLSEGAEKMGMRSGAAAMMKQQRGALENVYGLLLERADIRAQDKP